MYIFRGAAHTSSADRELELLSERWGREVLGNQQRQNRGKVRIEKVDFTFSPNSIHKKKGPPLSWHLETEEQAEIDRAWTGIRTGEQLRKYWRTWGSEKISEPLSCRIRFQDSIQRLTRLA